MIQTLIFLSKNFGEVESFLNGGAPMFSFKSEFDWRCSIFGDGRKLEEVSGDNELYTNQPRIQLEFPFQLT